MVFLSAELTAAAWWASVLLLKLATFGPIVGINRVKRKVFANPEDAQWKGGEVKYNHEFIERIRR